MDLETVKLTKEQGIATITLNRPSRLNALNRSLARDINLALTDIKGDSSVRVVVVTGAGRGFCAGGDFKGDEKSLPGTKLKPPEFVGMYRGEIGPVILGLQGCNVPTIAMVNGPAYGIGFDIALACDMRIGSDQARFCVAWLRRAIIPAGGTTWLLTRQIGLGRAAEIIFTGREVAAEEAERLGIINRMVPAANLEEETMELARHLAGMGPLALKMTKINLYRHLEVDLPAALDMLAGYQAFILHTDDHLEADKAFWEKRGPVFQGK